MLTRRPASAGTSLPDLWIPVHARQLVRLLGGREQVAPTVAPAHNVLTDELPVVAITLYGKNEISDLTPAEREGARRIVDMMKAELRRQKAGG